MFDTTETTAADAAVGALSAVYTQVVGTVLASQKVDHAVTFLTATRLVVIVSLIPIPIVRLFGFRAEANAVIELYQGEIDDDEMIKSVASFTATALDTLTPRQLGQVETLTTSGGMSLIVGVSPGRAQLSLDNGADAPWPLVRCSGTGFEVVAH